jgi:hypothetical protein
MLPPPPCSEITNFATISDEFTINCLLRLFPVWRLVFLRLVFKSKIFLFSYVQKSQVKKELCPPPSKERRLLLKMPPSGVTVSII